ncbi:AMP-binding protein [Streptomyces sp. SCL15-6]|uniref:AMP-binding protein n=1 Tax=Streptomyces sp. SCL15-6 TaxID=2967222 RepID=UPI00398FFEAB
MTTHQRKRREPTLPSRDGPPAALALDQIFAHTAGNHPNRVAIQDGWHRLTYAQADRQAVRLASALVRGGVQLGDPLVVRCENTARGSSPSSPCSRRGECASPHRTAPAVRRPPCGPPGRVPSCAAAPPTTPP